MSELDRRQQILDAALEVFSTQGFHKASIKSIARAADIKSSALIYHYFEDKKALLTAVMREMSPVGEIPILNPEMREQLLDVPPEMLLKEVASRFLSLLEDDTMRNLLRLFLSEAVRTPEVADSLIDTQEILLNFLKRYFKHQEKIGNFRQHNTDAAALSFVGLLIARMMTQLVFMQLGKNSPDKETYVNEIVHIFLDGIRRQA